MSSTGLRVILAIAVLLLLALVLWRPSSPGAPTVAAPAASIDEAEPPGALLEGSADHAQDADPGRVSIESAIAEPDSSPPAAGEFEFDVTFLPVDALGRALVGVSVDFGLQRHRTNRMGRSGPDGELHVKWRGTERDIDGVVCATEGLDSTCLNLVRLTAGRPCRVRFCADRLRNTTTDYESRVVVRQPYGASTGLRRDALFLPPAFQTDALGNGEFTDPDLLARLTLPGGGQGSGRPSSFRTRKLGGGKAARTPRTQIESFVHDPDGRGLAYVPWRKFGGKGSEGRNAFTDHAGRFALPLIQGGSLDLEIGGGLYPTVRRTFDLDAGGTQTWDVQLTPLPIVRGRLADSRGSPLGSWRIQVRENEAPYGFLQSCETKGGGAFEFGLARGAVVRLLASPPGENDRPAILIDEHVSTADDRLELVVPDGDRRCKVTWRIQVSDTALGCVPQARVIRRDSGEGITLGPCDGGQAANGLWQWAFCLENVLAGDYVVTNLAPGGRSELLVQVAGDQRDLGSFPLDGSIELIASEAAQGDEPRYEGRVVSRSQGVRVRSDKHALRGSFLAPAGELQLRISGETAEGQLVVRLRDVSGTGGTRFEIPLDEFR